jgi:replication-associated recombination protein RarA
MPRNLTTLLSELLRPQILEEFMGQSRGLVEENHV